jgi:hypothetical protein
VVLNSATVLFNADAHDCSTGFIARQAELKTDFNAIPVFDASLEMRDADVKIVVIGPDRVSPLRYLPYLKGFFSG